MELPSISVIQKIRQIIKSSAKKRPQPTSHTKLELKGAELHPNGQRNAYAFHLATIYKMQLWGCILHQINKSFSVVLFKLNAIY